MTPLATIHSCLLALAMLFLPSQVFAQTTKSSWQEDWGKSLEAARREGGVTVSIPASAAKYSRRAATPRCAGSLRSSKREDATSISTPAGSSSVVSGMLDGGILDMRLGQATRRERRQGSHVGQRVSPSRES